MARLIDSSVFIAIERRGESLYALGPLVSDDAFALASITVSELLVGVHRAATSSQRRRRQEFVEAVLDGIPILPFDQQVARTHAKLFSELSAAGKPLGANDLIIAATALTFAFDVLTQNLRHFSQVPDLVAYQPTW